MKGIIRLFVISFASVKLTQYVIGGFVFDHPSSIILFVLGLTGLYMFMRPMLRLVSMPSNGPGFLFMAFILTTITIQALTLFIPMFGVRPTTISELIIFGFVLPSKRLTAMWANVFSALLITILMWFFNWLCENKK